MEKQSFNISVFTENTVGILNRLTVVFTRRHINIHSITASETEEEDVYRYTIVVTESEAQVKKVIGQLERQIDVIRAFYHADAEVVYQELALVKVAFESSRMEELEGIIRANNARLIALTAEFVVFELTGHESAIQALLQALRTFDILEFSRSGRVAVTKPMKTLKTVIKELTY